MPKLKTAPKYVAVSLATLALCVSVQPTLAQDQSTETTAPTDKSADPTIALTSLVAVNSSLDDDSLRAAISDALIGHENELREWNADSLTIPEILVTIAPKTKKAKSTTITYSDVVLTNVRAGAAETMTIGAIATSNKHGAIQVDSLTFDNISLANIAHTTTPSVAAEDTFYPLYGNFSIAGASLNADDTECAIGSISGADVQMRPVGEAVANFIKLADSDIWDGSDDLALLAPLLTSYAHLVTSVKSGPSEIEDFYCREVSGDDENKFNDRVDIETISIAAIEPGFSPAVTAQNIRGTFEDENHLSITEISSKPSDFTDIIAAIEAAPQPITEEWMDTNQRLLSPNFAGLSFTGLELDFVDDEPFKLTVADFDLTLANYINGIPSKADVSANNIIVNIPENESDELLSMMLLAGLTEINGSFRVAGEWSEADEAITLEEISFDLKDMGSVKLDGLLVNASPMLFDVDYIKALAASRALALSTLNLSTVDNGIGEVVLAAVSGEMGADANAMRPVYADLVKGTIIAYLADLADSADLGDAVSKFVAGTAKTLNIGISARSENGISLEEFEAAEDDPMAILAKINVTANAQ
ncbi:hypothetical protein [Devosia sp. MC521]|uniref:hypothetical protein n=1 Tax=Devosia sp. MC521 TaxID=2759954 RepID=UPI0015F87BC2|nr:hypothetical protein [Devosia sp. MC521]MBJ6986103.1 hypothetical protein [Devosia sp. MC521]QMW61472.1 hypothetical protein H4N61_10820 [Devosia sp. MC521]